MPSLECALEPKSVEELKLHSKLAIQTIRKATSSLNAPSKEQKLLRKLPSTAMLQVKLKRKFSLSVDRDKIRVRVIKLETIQAID